MMALRRKKREMMRDIEICQNELSAKEAVLTEVVRMINRLPQHPSSAPLIANVLHSQLKIKNECVGKFKCIQAWSALFDEFMVVAIDAQNDSSQICIPLCTCLTDNCVSKTKTTVFDGLQTDICIPGPSKRTIVASFEKSLLLSGRALLIIDCEFVNASALNITQSLLPMIHPFANRWSQTRAVKKFDIKEPIKKFSCEEICSISMEDCNAFYQCLRTSYCSKILDVTQTGLNDFLKNDRFKQVDFGDWQLMAGSTNTIWERYFIYSCSSRLQSMPHEIRLFARSDCDVRRLANVLIANKTKS